MVGCINGCESVNIVILSVVHLSKFGCFFIRYWCGFCFLFSFFVLLLSCTEQSQVVLIAVFSSGPAPK